MFRLWLSLSIACGGGGEPTHEPGRQSESPPELREPAAGEEPSASRPDVAEDMASEGCAHVVFDADPPSRVRAGPSSRSAAVDDLRNGTFVHVVETEGGWARIESPRAGWVYRRNLYDTCESPAAAPAVPLGPRTYVLTGEWAERTTTGGEALPKPPMDPDLAVMELHRRESVRVAPIVVTLATKTGSCVRESVQRVVLGADCPEWGVEAPALEVESCPQLTEDRDDRAHVTEPLMVAVFGRHVGARLEEWSHGETDTRPTRLAVVNARARDPGRDDEPPVTTGFGRSEWSWIYHRERHWLFRGDSLIDELDMTASPPMRAVVRNTSLVAVGNFGHHGYGFYMFPRRPLPEQARELSFPNFTCGAY